MPLCVSWLFQSTRVTRPFLCSFKPSHTYASPVEMNNICNTRLITYPGNQKTDYLGGKIRFQKTIDKSSKIGIACFPLRHTRVEDMIVAQVEDLNVVVEL